MSKQLPEHPDGEQLKKQAKDLLHEVRAGQSEAVARIGSENRATFALHDAQRVIAREYGFPSWAKLKAHVEARVREEAKIRFHQAFDADDTAEVRRLLQKIPTPGALLNPLVSYVRSGEMLDLLLEAGADIDAKHDSLGGGFGVLHQAGPEVAAYAMARGAAVDIHAAARLGLAAKVQELVAANPSLVRSPGGDGQTPLHFAATVPIADYLLDRGAEIDALDVDHVSTPAQYMVDDRQEVARRLVARGCRTDLLMLAALGDQPRIQDLLDRDPEAIRLRVTDEFFPMIGSPNATNGGTIYQWKLGWYVSAFDVARKFGHQAVCRFLWARSPADVRFLQACWDGDLAAARTAAEAGGIVARNFPTSDRRHLAHAARNNNLAAVKTMLELEFPLDGTSQHGATALHFAAYHGNAAMVKLLLPHGPSLTVKDADFGGPPFGWALHGSYSSWFRQSGDYGAVVELLIEAGSEVFSHPQASAEVMAVLRKHGKGGAH
jgi:ankyrin repeat protein